MRQKGRETPSGSTICGCCDDLHIEKLTDRIRELFCVLNSESLVFHELVEGVFFGQVIAKGTAEDIQNNPEVIKAYLGSNKEG